LKWVINQHIDLCGHVQLLRVIYIRGAHLFVILHDLNRKAIGVWGETMTLRNAQVELPWSRSVTTMTL
jgi:hypothetical protein